MKTEIADKWIETLRSGEYAQGRSRLRNSSNAFCCLGVLCDLYQRETGKRGWRRSNLTDSYAFPNSDGFYSRSHLAPDVREWAGMKTDDGHLGGTKETLAQKNDGGATFEEIAALIEANKDIL